MKASPNINLDLLDSNGQVFTTLEPYLKDALEITQMFVGSPFALLGGKSLVSVLSFNSSQYTASKRQAELALVGKNLKDYNDFRFNLVATRLAYEKEPEALFRPCAVNAPSPLDRLKDSLIRMLTNDSRSEERPRSSQQQLEIDQQSQRVGEDDYLRFSKVLIDQSNRSLLLMSGR